MSKSIAAAKNVFVLVMIISCWSLRPPFTIRRMYIAKVMTHHMAANDRDIVKLLIVDVVAASGKLKV